MESTITPVLNQLHDKANIISFLIVDEKVLTEHICELHSFIKMTLYAVVYLKPNTETTILRQVFSQSTIAA